MKTATRFLKPLATHGLAGIPGAVAIPGPGQPIGNLWKPVKFGRVATPGVVAIPGPVGILGAVAIPGPAGIPGAVATPGAG